MYVIIVESGEYSDRDDWIGGIFDNKEEAQSILTVKSAAARQYRNDHEEWRKKRLENYNALEKLGKELDALDKQNGPFNEEGEVKSMKERQNLEAWHERRQILIDSIKELETIDRKQAEQYKREPGERFYIVEVPVNTWGNYPYC